jgi:hypothetical protein
MQQQDWFSQNAPPPAVAATGGDWFAANAPKAKSAPLSDDASMAQLKEKIARGEELTPEEKQDVARTDASGLLLGDYNKPGQLGPKQFVKDSIKNVYEVSAPNVFHQLYKHQTGQPNNLQELPEKGAEFATYSMIGGEPKPEVAGERGAMESVARAPERPTLLAKATENFLVKKTANRLAERVLRLVPGVGKVLDVADLAKEIHANLTAAPEAAKPPAPPAAVLPPPRFDVIGANDTERAMLTVRGTRPPVTELPPNNAGLALTAGEQAPSTAPAVSVRPELQSMKVMKTTPSGTRMVRNPAYPVRLKNGEVVKGKAFDLWEDKAIEDAAREDLAMHGRHAWKQVMDEFRANNDASVAKGQQVAAAKDWFAKNAPATAGTVEGATADTAFYQAARREMGESASMSDVLKRAQEMKTAADSNAQDLTDLLRRSVKDALAKKKK